jgi:hypothetical protein
MVGSTLLNCGGGVWAWAMTSLLLHVGLHKTATTSFQGFLHRHDEVLASCGCLYPRTARAPGPQHALLPGCYFPNHPFLPRDRSLSVDHYITQLVEELDRAPYWLCVISSEVFTELLNVDLVTTRDLIVKLSGHFKQVKILLTLRDLPRLAYSDLKNRLRDISLGLRRDIAFSAPMFFARIERAKRCECDQWRTLGFPIVERCMDDVVDPVGFYLEAILDMLPSSARLALQSAVGNSTVSADDRNADPFAEVEYLLMILAGLKLAAAGKSDTAQLTLEATVLFLRTVKAAEACAQLGIDAALMIQLVRTLFAQREAMNSLSVMQMVGLSASSAAYLDTLSERLAKKLAG